MQLFAASVTVLAYGAALIFVAVMNRREFSRNPEKGVRYELLPLRFKLLCWLFIIPLFVASLVGPAFVENCSVWIGAILGLSALVGFALLERACVRWYRENGHL